MKTYKDENNRVYASTDEKINPEDLCSQDDNEQRTPLVRGDGMDLLSYILFFLLCGIVVLGIAVIINTFII
jgi:hypothetical protein